MMKSASMTRIPPDLGKRVLIILLLLLPSALLASLPLPPASPKALALVSE